MNNKRLIGSICIKNNIAVQSFGYSNYLPLGNPAVIAENLSRWQVDEILINFIDQSISDLGPNIHGLQEINLKKINTPIIYSGGLTNAKDAINVIKMGADRVCVDNLLHSNPKEIINISRAIGSQAVILSLPISVINKKILIYDYKKKKNLEITNEIKNILQNNYISEVLLIDWKNEGHSGKFNMQILDKFDCPNNVKIIGFGGLDTINKISTFLDNRRTSAVSIGNIYNYTEHAVSYLRKKIKNKNIRKTFFYEE